MLLALGTAEALTSGPAAAAAPAARPTTRLEDPVARGEIAAAARAASLLFTGFADGGGARSPSAAAAAARRPTPTICAAALEALELAACFFGGGGDGAARPPGRATGTRRPGRARARGRSAGVAGLRLGQPRRHRPTSAPRSRCAALEDGALLARPATALIVDHRHGHARAGRPRRGARRRSTRCEAEAHRRGSLLDICSVHLWRGYTLLAARRSSRRPSELIRAADAELRHLRARRAAPRRPTATRSSARCSSSAATSPARARALEHSAGRGRRAPTRARHWLHAQLALLVAEGRWEEALAAAEEFARALRRPTATRPQSPWRVADRAEALDRLGRARRGARARARGARAGAPAGARRARSAGRCACSARLEREAGLAQLEEAVDVLAGSAARLEHAKALAALGVGAAPRAAARPTRASRCARARAGRGVRRARRSPTHVRTELYAAGARPRTDALAGRRAR